jgi:uncharacterized protein (DUF302 family)
MKNYQIGIIGLVAGMIITAIGTGLAMPSLMLNEIESPIGVDETVEKVKETAIQKGWVVSSVSRLNDSVKKHGGGELPKIRLVNLCQPHHAYKILTEDDSKKVSVMMPCTISVYEKSDGKTYIGTMNAGLLGKMFGGTVAEVMGTTVAKEQKEFIGFATK